MGISKRLKYIAELVSRGNTACDIGTDHGYVPVYLVKQGISPSALAVDLSAGSLEKARELIKRMDLEGQIECRISDGFTEIKPFEADTVIISGMGGILISNIIEKRPEVFESFKEVIVSPHRDADLVRTVITGHGLQIKLDEMIEDKGKQYTVIRAVRPSD